MYYFDSHAHFGDKGGADGYESVIPRAVEAGTERIMAIGGSGHLNAAALCVAAAHPENVRASVGFDRDQAQEFAASGATAALSYLTETLDARQHVLAIGEVGLDYHYSPESAPMQRDLFAAQLGLALERKLPVVIHNRDSDEDMHAMLSSHAKEWGGDPDRIGVLHCFTGSVPFAKQLLDLGFYISFSGIVTFRNAEALRRVASMVPDDKILIETDSPYLAPVPMRGKRNEPGFVKHVAECLAEERGTNLETIANITAQNASRLFGWE